MEPAQVRAEPLLNGLECAMRCLQVVAKGGLRVRVGLHDPEVTGGVSRTTVIQLGERSFVQEGQQAVGLMAVLGNEEDRPGNDFNARSLDMTCPAGDLQKGRVVVDARARFTTID